MDWQGVLEIITVIAVVVVGIIVLGVIGCCMFGLPTAIVECKLYNDQFNTKYTIWDKNTFKAGALIK